MRGRLLALVAAAAMAAAGGFAGVPDATADHCGPVFVFSGVRVGPVRGPASNPGATCATRDENVDTNILNPGANYLVVGTTVTPVSGTGTLVIDDRPPITLAFTYAPASRRWNSQDVDLAGGGVATAAVQSVTGVTVSVTYRAVTP